jgi:hypothetical protein
LQTNRRFANEIIEIAQQPLAHDLDVSIAVRQPRRLQACVELEQ